MKNKLQITIFAMTIIFLLPVVSESMEIRQEQYDFPMDITRNVSCITFVISEIPGRNRVSANSFPLPTVHFELGSADLSFMAGQELLAGMRELGIAPDTPLIVTGHSCELGEEEYNFKLSLLRAVAVASFLERKGYTSTTIRAEGESDPITIAPQEFYKNRRVEISTQ